MVPGGGTYQGVVETDASNLDIIQTLGSENPAQDADQDYEKHCGGWSLCLCCCGGFLCVCCCPVDRRPKGGQGIYDSPAKSEKCFCCLPLYVGVRFIGAGYIMAAVSLISAGLGALASSPLIGILFLLFGAPAYYAAFLFFKIFRGQETKEARAALPKAVLAVIACICLQYILIIIILFAVAPRQIMN